MSHSIIIANTFICNKLFTKFNNKLQILAKIKSNNKLKMESFRKRMCLFLYKLFKSKYL